MYLWRMQGTHYSDCGTNSTFLRMKCSSLLLHLQVRMTRCYFPIAFETNSPLDEYTEALLAVHEAEIAHLERLLEERGPILSLIERHRSLLDDREQLSISSNDASRLTARGGARDPTRLLREEKMRKRIAKDLPKVEAELRAALELWEEESGTPFTVRGEDYLQTLPVVIKPPARSSSRGPASASGSTNQKCSPTPGPQTRGHRSQSVRDNRPNPQPILKHSASTASTATNVSRSNAISRPKTPGAPGAPKEDVRPKTSFAHRPKTPTSTIRGTPTYSALSKTPSRNSRPGLSTMTHDTPSNDRTSGGTAASDTRSLASYKSTGSIRRKMPPPATPNVSGQPRLGKHTSPSQQTLRRGDSMHSRSSREGSVDQSIRCITPPEPSTPSSGFHNRAYLRNGASAYKGSSAEGMSPKQSQQLHPRAFSGTSSESSSTVVSSENWETFDDTDEDEDVRSMYLQKLRLNSGQKSPIDYNGYRNFGGALPNSSIAIVGDDEWDEHERN